MFDEISSKITRALKRSRVLVRVKGQDPDTGYRVAAKYVLEELERSYEIRRRGIAPGHKTPENEK